MKSFAAICAVTFATAFAIPVQANTPLYQAACEYRNAVRDFEDTIQDMRCVHDSQRRLVDRLEDSTSVLRSHSKRPDRFDRFLCAWSETKSLHVRVKYSVVAPYADYPEILHGWERVQCAYRGVEKEVDCILRRHQPSVPFNSYRFGVEPPVIQAPRIEAPRINAPHVPVPRIESPSILPPIPRVQTSYRDGRFDHLGSRYDRDRRNLDESYYSRRMMHSSDIRSAMIGAMLSRFAR